MKFGFDEKKDIHETVHSETVAHDHVPGRAFEIHNPADKLIHIIGGGFFNEPRYYDSNRNYADFRAELIANNGKITSRILDNMGLTEQARAVISAMNDVANSDTPEDLFVIAAWARDKNKGLKLRTTPQIALTLGSHNEKTKPFVRKYATSIMTRLDEIRQVFAAYRHLFQQTKAEERVEAAKVGKRVADHHGSIPSCLRKGIAEVLAAASPYSLLKYNSDERPTLKDVLLMVTGWKKLPKRRDKHGNVVAGGFPLSKAMFEYIVNGKVLEDAPEMIKLREKFFKEIKSVKDVTPEFLEKAGLTWENVTSHLGASKEVWEFCIPLMNEMALTRNLSNFEQHKISKQSWDLVYEKAGKTVDSVQLPFRFFTASKQVGSTDAKTLVSMQLDKSVENVPELPGVTVVMVDNSGSAVGAAISGKSDMRVSDCGNMLAAIVAKRMGRNAVVGVFGDSLIWVPFSANESTMAIKEKIDSVAQKEDRSKYGALGIKEGYRGDFTKGTGVGGGTETGLWFGIDDLTKRKIKVDRWILLSDLCCYTQGDDNCGVKMGKYFGSDKASIQSMLDLYRRNVNPDCYVYSVNLAGYKQSQIRPTGKRNHLLSGWSEQIFSIMRDIEGEEAVQSQQKQESVEVPTIAVLRGRYKNN